MRAKLKRLLPLVDKATGNFPIDKLKFVNEILDFIFPYGKYKGERFGNVIVNDYNYCLWWLKQNTIVYYMPKVIPFSLKLHFIEKNRIAEKIIHYKFA